MSSTNVDNADSHVLLSYYVLGTAVLMFVVYAALLHSTLPPSSPPTSSQKPSTTTPPNANTPNPILLPNYTLAHHASLSPLLARTTGVWFLVSGLVRLGAFLTWGRTEDGFRGWYDATIVSLVVPLWHYGLERAVWGTVSVRQLALAYAIDGVGTLWMLGVRRGVFGLA